MLAFFPGLHEEALMLLEQKSQWCTLNGLTDDAIDAHQSSLKIVQRTGIPSLSFLINHSFYLFLEKKFKEAERAANLALMLDRTNVKALINKANCLFFLKNEEDAMNLYKKALSLDQHCIEALHNILLIYKHWKRFDDALRALEDLSQFFQNEETCFQLADLREQMGNWNGALSAFTAIVSPVPTIYDPEIFNRMAQIHEKLNNGSRALQYYLESFKNFPSDLDVLKWLAENFWQKQNYKHAVIFYTIAAELDSSNFEWTERAAYCYRKLGQNFKTREILQCYQEIYPNQLGSKSIKHLLPNDT
ncbi:tetratricopeptide repeat-containing protein [Cardiosporidium cionae]|uniref:Tetratricopeptide repeat-containing protein n=1 Tax=Cardiosporidium cionae TaxID=476202 RepID=A0ABQ7J8C1_9APIC|nr:tetratricopeptide repeat-containing protein [Cardiosporidium cionae]|eukprot:KAF8820184.1 tetratricopeptide repeat-containing protein [Cardiosporidium cionae]